jgi:hypothetical protein
MGSSSDLRGFARRSKWRELTDAELVARRSIKDLHERDLRSAGTAVSIFNSVGVTATQDAASMGVWLDVFTELDRAGELNAWIVGSMPAREFVESGRWAPTCSTPLSRVARCACARTSSREFSTVCR